MRGVGSMCQYKSVEVRGQSAGADSEYHTHSTRLRGK